MIPLASHRGYTICRGHPDSLAALAAVSGGDCWFEGESLEDVKALIDEALEGA